MNDKFVNMGFKIGVLLIGMAFLMVYFFHSQNGRFYKIGDASDFQILDTRTGVVHVSVSGSFASINLTNGKVELIKAAVTPAAVPTVPAAPAAPNTPKQSAEDFLKRGK